MKQISFNLSVKSVQNAISEIQKYKEEVNRKCQLLAQRLAEEGVIIAKIKIMQFPAILTGELLNSISCEPGAIFTNGARWTVYTGCEWAKFVEFGTGIVGSQNPHPDTSLMNWKYDINDHGERGWLYYKDGDWHWTRGMPSRPFFYETGKDLSMIVSKVAVDVFGRVS